MAAVIGVIQNKEDESLSTIQQACTGIYFNTEGKIFDESSDVSSPEEGDGDDGDAVSLNPSAEGKKKHVMISYNWDVQQSMIEVIKTMGVDKKLTGIAGQLCFLTSEEFGHESCLQTVL